MELHTQLPLHKIVPLFTLPDKHGDSFNLARKRGKQHFLLLVWRDGTASSAYLRELAASAESWRQIPARAIVVVPDDDTAGALGALPFDVLIDREGRVAQQFLGPDAGAGAFALDRYAELYHQWLASDSAGLPGAEELGGWLEAISMQCSI